LIYLINIEVVISFIFYHFKYFINKWIFDNIKFYAFLINVALFSINYLIWLHSIEKAA